MRKVILALTPLALASIYFFGWRALLTLTVVNIAGTLSEFIFAKIYKKKVTEAVFVTNFLFALSLPPNLPLWIAVVGIVFGVIFGKMVFGGFGRNIFNPAITGRAFIYVSFGGPMTSQWFAPVGGSILGGFTAFAPDVVASATPLAQIGEGGHSLLPLLLGNTGGCLGETSAVLIVLCGLFLVFNKTANWKIILSGILGFGLLQTIFWLIGRPGTADPLSALLAGSILYGLFFMATDPVSASQTTDGGRIIYGALIGLLTVTIRLFSSWPAGITFAILIANMFAPLLDTAMKAVKDRKKRGAEA